MTGTVALIDYGSGNLRSAEKALARAAAESASGHEIVVTADADVAAKAERIVLPGVGAFADCMRGLQAVPGMADALKDAVLKRGVPFLGICVGMQLMASVGREFGDHAGLGWINGEVVKITPADPSLKIPHMGWNELALLRPHPVLNGIASGAHAYFVHSYEMRTASASDVLAVTDYGGAITAMVGKGNMVGTQFHPEKSQATGLKLLANFLGWRP
ncbi:MAG TPA: imidazole glycerol phosphate synthase subunit HisH [Rhizomicrobium sp.]|jgi:glutamine amidotransferase|nr:imidazole glycerol phosphate synthase subunit HisH [Rhizomicrobium sp.]